MRNSHGAIIARLNEALDSAWSFEVVHHEVREEEVVVLGAASTIAGIGEARRYRTHP